MRVLWICNIMLPAVAEKLGKIPSNKEGWLSGLAEALAEGRFGEKICLGVAFPVPGEMDGCQGEMPFGKSSLRYYGFYENTACPEKYDKGLEGSLAAVMEDFGPDVVHCFGTEYPHTLAAARVCPDKRKLLIGIQGLCLACAEAYMADLPDKVIRSVTFRDFVKRDSLRRQRDKFVRRGEHEREALSLAGNITGRTQWDRSYSLRFNPQAEYFAVNETLRADFYEGRWDRERCVPYRIFVSQGDYPLKGLHYLLTALPKILSACPEARVYVAGNSPVKDFDPIRISAYGKYLGKILRREGLEDKVIFLGSLTAQEMKEQYLAASLFVCCSSVENSPNSLGEAMLLGVPCVSARVGGIESIFEDGRDGILFEGYGGGALGEDGLWAVSERLAEAVLSLWSDGAAAEKYCENARNHARRTHDRETNCRKTVEMYTRIAQKVTGNGQARDMQGVYQ